VKKPGTKSARTYVGAAASAVQDFHTGMLEKGNQFVRETVKPEVEAAFKRSGFNVDLNTANLENSELYALAKLANSKPGADPDLIAARDAAQSAIKGLAKQNQGKKLALLDANGNLSKDIWPVRFLFETEDPKTARAFLKKFEESPDPKTFWKKFGDDFTAQKKAASEAGMDDQALKHLDEAFKTIKDNACYGYPG